MAIIESVVLVAVPEADQVIGDLRRQSDRPGGVLVPAHVTVLYPFAPPERLDDDAFEALRAAVASVPSFEAEFRRVEWFDDTVVWLAPEPAGPFVALTEAVQQRFPEYLAYGGAHGEPVPHLTIGTNVPVEQLRSAAAQAARQLPIRTFVRRALLMAGLPDAAWTIRAELPLGPPAP